VPEFQQIGVFAVPTGRPAAPPAPAPAFWRDLADELKSAATPEAREAIVAKYAASRSNAAAAPAPGAPRPRRQRRGSTLEPVTFRPLDRNQRARLIFLAERLDAQTRDPGKHGGCLKRTGLAVLRVLLFHFHNVHNGRCDPSYDTIARGAAMARSTVAEALNRLEEAGIITRIRRARWVRQGGRKRCVQWSNAYILDLPDRFRKAEAAWYTPAKPSGSGKRAETTTALTEDGAVRHGDICPELQRALARLGNAIADREERARK
jgi:DNA-binding transcriptional ArsR family regulator